MTKYYQSSPSQLSTGEIQQYFLYLVKERGIAPVSRRLALNGIVFMHRAVLHRKFEAKIHFPKRPQRLPELLTRQEVAAILAAFVNRKHRMMLTVCYGCGLGVKELVHLQVRDVDGERRLLRIDQGKGAKDRLVEIAPILLVQLRQYWKVFLPYCWLFPGRDPSTAPGITSVYESYTAAKGKARGDKIGGIHSLRKALT